jgi:amino acid transporter
METTTTRATSPKKISLGSVSFLVAILLFLLPFVEIKCNDQTLATNTGIGLAFGTDYKTIAQKKTLDNPLGNSSEKAVTEKQQGEMYVSALIALLLGAIGFVLSLMKSNKAGVFIGGLAAICLIILMIQIQMDIKDKPNTSGEDDFTKNIKVTAEFTAWYYLSLISFIAAAFFSYRRKPIVISG